MRRIPFILLAVVLAVPAVVQAQETLAGVGAASGIAAGMGAMAAGSLNPAKLAGKASRQPRFPSFNERDRSGGSAATMGGSPQAPQMSSTAPVHLNTATGAGLINELLSHHSAVRPPVARSRAARRRTASRRSAQRVSSASQPVANWLRYYLPQDRYKVRSGQWKYVSVEDDAGVYPVRYYYNPRSRAFINLLSRHPRNGQARANRVIGFHTWQDAMRAGYRPDPASRPEPASGIIYLASLTRTPELDRYVEYVYNGQVAPDSFESSIIYAHQVEHIVNSRSDTRPLLAATMSQVYGAFIGQNALPTTVGLSHAEPVQTAARGMGNAGRPGNPDVNGAATGTAPGNVDSREESFNSFSNRAGKLANVPGNSGR